MIVATPTGTANVPGPGKVTRNGFADTPPLMEGPSSQCAGLPAAPGAAGRRAIAGAAHTAAPSTAP